MVSYIIYLNWGVGTCWNSVFLNSELEFLQFGIGFFGIQCLSEFRSLTKSSTRFRGLE